MGSYTTLYKCLLLGFVLSVLFAVPAQAFQKIVYNHNPSSILQYKLVKLLGDEPTVQNMSVAAIDLNEDGIYEYIIQAEDCNGQTLCQHEIIADSSKALISLAKIEAKNLALDENYQHGIRNIRAYTNPNSDYKYDLYSWNPAVSKFVISPSKKGGEDDE